METGLTRLHFKTLRILNTDSKSKPIENGIRLPSLVRLVLDGAMGWRKISAALRGQSRRQHARLVCLSDATGSMRSLWNNAQSTINVMIRRIKEIGGNNFDLLWVAYRDYSERDNMFELSGMVWGLQMPRSCRISWTEFVAMVAVTARKLLSRHCCWRATNIVARASLAWSSLEMHLPTLRRKASSFQATEGFLSWILMGGVSRTSCDMLWRNRGKWKL